jgi:hypothetical protein
LTHRLISRNCDHEGAETTWCKQLTPRTKLNWWWKQKHIYIYEQIVGSSRENSRGSGAKALVFIWKIFQKNHSSAFIGYEIDFARNPIFFMNISFSNPNLNDPNQPIFFGWIEWSWSDRLICPTYVQLQFLPFISQILSPIRCYWILTPSNLIQTHICIYGIWILSYDFSPIPSPIHCFVSEKREKLKIKNKWMMMREKNIMREIGT